MNNLALHALHEEWGGSFVDINGEEVAGDYSDVGAEYRFLRETVAVIDLSFRSRLCLLGADRTRFLHGQVTNDVNRLRVGEGCYAALVTGKGKMQSDLNIWCLQDELLLDFEPGLTDVVSERLRKYVIADDVEVVDVRPHFGMLGIAGPKGAEALKRIGITREGACPEWSIVQQSLPKAGEIYVAQRARFGIPGCDLFVPVAACEDFLRRLVGVARLLGGGPCGWKAMEVARIEAGIPRFGMDMDETNLAPEAGLDATAISYSKGCYIGQEIIARVRTYGHVAKKLSGLDLGDGLTVAPESGSKLQFQGKDAGYLTSATFSPVLGRWIGMAYIRREANKEGELLELTTKSGPLQVRVVSLPFLSK